MANSSLDYILDCTHEYIEDGACMECGITSISGGHIRHEADFDTKTQKTSITQITALERDLRSVELPPEIKEWVLQQLKTAPKNSHKGRSRKCLLYAYIYLAYLHFRIPFNPEKLAESMNIRGRTLSDALKMASGISDKSLTRGGQELMLAPIVVQSPLDYIGEVLEKAGMTEYTDSISTFIREAVEADMSLLEEHPLKMAVAFLKQYADDNNLEMHASKFHQLYGVSATSLKVFVEKVQRV